MKTRVSETTPLYELKKIQSDFPKEKITRSEDSQKFILQFYGDDIDVYESFFVLLLNQNNTTIGYVKISQGGITGTVVDPVIVAKYAIESLAKGVILAHNHPSGNLTVSRQDSEITEKIKTGLKFFDIKVLDHLILTGSEKYTSMADLNLL